MSVWGSSPSDVYVVGGAPGRGKIAHFDGADWTDPLVGTSTVPLVNWAYGFGPNQVFFAAQSGVILRADGAQITQMTTPTTEDLWGVWGAAPNDLWAVGGRGQGAGQATLLHYDGVAWTQVALPPLQRANVFAFFKVWGTSANNVYVVGQRGVVLHYDGQQWTELLVGATGDLVALWGTGPDRIAMVGGRGNGQIVTYDGVSFRQQSLSPLPGLSGVWMGRPDRIHVGGEDGLVARVDFDSLTVVEEPVDTRLSLHALFGDGARLWAVGGSLLSLQPPHRGVVLRRAQDP